MRACVCAPGMAQALQGPGAGQAMGIHRVLKTRPPREGPGIPMFKFSHASSLLRCSVHSGGHFWWARGASQAPTCWCCSAAPTTSRALTFADEARPPSFSFSWVAAWCVAGGPLLAPLLAPAQFGRLCDIGRAVCITRAPSANEGCPVSGGCCYRGASDT